MASITALRASSQPTATQMAVTGHERPLMSSEALVLENVTRAFGALRAVDDVSFSVLAGEKRAILGPMALAKQPCSTPSPATFLPPKDAFFFLAKTSRTWILLKGFEKACAALISLPCCSET